MMVAYNINMIDIQSLIEYLAQIYSLILTYLTKTKVKLAYINNLLLQKLYRSEIFSLSINSLLLTLKLEINGGF